MISVEDLPQSVKDNVVNVEVVPHPFNDALIVSFRNGLDVSVVSGPNTYGGLAGLFEIAVGFVGEGVWEDSPFTEPGGVTGWLTDRDVVDKLAEVAEYDSPEVQERQRKRKIEEVELLITATQFGILRLAGLNDTDDPFEYLNADDAEREALGLSFDVRQTLRSLSRVADEAILKLYAE